MKKRITALLLVALTAATFMLAGCGGNKFTPTFMYFVSNSDTDFDKTNEMFEELKKEYKKDVKFELVNIDEDVEAAANFPVLGNTPMLIMLNTSNDISAMAPKCNDAVKLREYIEAALK